MIIYRSELYENASFHTEVFIGHAESTEITERIGRTDCTDDTDFSKSRRKHRNNRNFKGDHEFH